MTKLRFVAFALLLSLQLEAHPLNLSCHPQLSKTDAAPGFQTALDNLYSFSYIRKAFKEVQKKFGQVEFCTSMIVLGKNDYQYDRYLIRIDINAQNGNTQAFYFLFQNASVQAFHNNGGQPWVGLAKNDVEFQAQALLDSNHFTPVLNSTLSLKEIVQSSDKYQKDLASIDPDSLSFIRLYKTKEKEVLAYTWQTKSSSNTYASVVRDSGVLIEMNQEGEIRVSENFSPVEKLFFPLQEKLSQTYHQIGNGYSWIDYLLEISSFTK